MLWPLAVGARAGAKDRIDGFYLRVLELRKSATLGNPVEALSELETLERAAFDGLVNERLAGGR